MMMSSSLLFSGKGGTKQQNKLSTATATALLCLVAQLFTKFSSPNHVVLVNAQSNNNDTDVGIGGVSDITVVSIGDTYCVEGYVMDSYCIDIGSLLDKPNIKTLEGPDQHSIHCLVDVGPCLNSPFEILTPPPPAISSSQGSNKYERSWRITDDDGSKTVLVDLARSIGSCSTCNGGYTNGGQRSGFKAVMDATIVGFRSGTAPPLISITQAYDSTQFESSTQACQQYFPDLELGTTISGGDGGDSTGNSNNNENNTTTTTTTMPPSATSAPVLQVGAHEVSIMMVSTILVALLSIMIL